jgi:hypothetical protein
MTKSPHHNRFLAAGIFFLISTGLVCLVLAYASTAYSADDRALQTEKRLKADGHLTWENGYAILTPDDSDQQSEGIIFYPGGLVDARAYLPQLDAFRKKGFTCVLLTMPFDLAVFDMKAADYIYPNLKKLDVKNWYLSGHSLGGVAAGQTFRSQKHPYAGLILLASYVTDPKTDAGDVLTIYGSQDHVLHKEKVSLKTSQVEVLDGGNHGQFGDYGHQAGDGNARIDHKTQQSRTAEAVWDFVSGESRK